MSWLSTDAPMRIHAGGAATGGERAHLGGAVTHEPGQVGLEVGRAEELGAERDLHALLEIGHD